MKSKLAWTGIVLCLLSSPLESYAMFQSLREAARQVRQFPRWVRQTPLRQLSLHPAGMRAPVLPQVSLQKVLGAEAPLLRESSYWSFSRNHMLLPTSILQFRDFSQSFGRFSKLKNNPQTVNVSVDLSALRVGVKSSLDSNQAQSEFISRDEFTPQAQGKLTPQEKKLTEVVLMVDGPLSDDDKHLKDHLIQVDEGYQRAASDQIQLLLEKKSIASLEHAHYVGYLLTQNEHANRLKIIPRLFYHSQSIYQDIHEAYEKGCRLANLSLSIDIARTDLSQFSKKTLELGRKKLSEPLVEHVAGHFLNVVEALSEEKLTAEGRDQWLGFIFKVLNEGHSQFKETADSSELSPYAIGFLEEFKIVAELQIIPDFYALGGDQLEAAIADHPDMLFVMASGNDGYDLEKLNPWKPVIQGKKYDNVLVVASSDASGALSPFSNYGEATVHLATQGQDLNAITVYGANRQISGTSFAVPRVVRLIAKMRLINPDLKPIQIKSILEKTVEKRSELKNRLIWGGLLDEQAALAETIQSL